MPKSYLKCIKRADVQLSDVPKPEYLIMNTLLTAKLSMSALHMGHRMGGIYRNKYINHSYDFG